MRKSWQPFVLSGVLVSTAFGGMSASPVSYAANYSQSSSLEQRVTRLEKMAQNPVLLQLMQRMETQESELQELQDRVDRLQRDLAQLKAKESKHYQEGDERLSVLEAQLSDIQKRLSAQALNADAQPLQTEEAVEGVEPLPSDKAAVPLVTGPQETNLPAPSTSQPSKPASKSDQSAQVKQVKPVTPVTPITTHFPTDEEKSIYKAAFNLVKHSKYDQAIEKFKDFQKLYPGSKLAANAAYWEGEVYLLKKQNDEALKAFDKVLNLYPDSLKTPDALLRKADTLVLLGKKEEAKSLYETLRRDYPNSRAAKNVAKRLEILGEDDSNTDKANASGGKK